MPSLLLKKRTNSEAESSIRKIRCGSTHGKNSSRRDVGPLTLSDRGNRYVLVAMDYFSKWPEAYALPAQDAKSVAEVLVNQFVSRFGVPLELHSDQGTNFESATFKEMCRILGIKKTRTTPLHPQSDGMVERYNRTLKGQIANVCQRSSTRLGR